MVIVAYSAFASLY